MKIQPVLDDKRCTVCNRFIPRGYVARVSAGTAQCLIHPVGIEPIAKADLGHVIHPSPKSARREATKAAVRRQRELRAAAGISGGQVNFFGITLID